MTNINWVITNLHGESHEVHYGILMDEQKNMDEVAADREDSIEIDYTEKGEIEYNVLRDIYYPVIRQLIDEKIECQNNDVRSKSNLIKNLEILDGQHEALMIAKRFLWEEIDRGIYFLNEDCTNEFDKTLLHFYENRIIIPFFYIYELVGGYQFIKKLYYYDLKLWKEVTHALVDLRYDFEYHHNISVMNRNVWRLLSNFRDNKMGHIGTKIWMLFLISIFFEDDEDFRSNIRKIDIQNMKEYLELISSYQKQIDTQLIKEQRALQNDMLNLCNFIMKSKEPDIFERKTDHIVEVLETIPDLKKKYISKQGRGCFATLTSGGKKYVAISGLKHDSGDFERFIRTTLDNTYELIKLDLHTRYYYKKKKYINYQMYTNNKSKCRKIKNIDLINRMFSCCEKNY